MALENLVIHDVTDADFDLTKYEYHQVMFGNTATIVLNGTSVTVSGPLTINLRIRTIDISGVPASTVYAMGYRGLVEPLGLHVNNGLLH